MAEFRSKTGGPVTPKSPVHLFELLTSRSPDVKYLWAHQQAVLDSYAADYADASDVALELPTGSGKTLVGMLLAEYRRRGMGERAAVLCPTRQLADQVSLQAQRYGIPAVLLVGRQANYELAGYLKYESAKAIAITTYSGVFNTNPRIDTPQTLICDDAHAAGDFIAGMWSLSIRADETADLFGELTRLLDDAIPNNAKPQVVDDPGFTGRYVDAVSPILLRDYVPELTKLFDSRLGATRLQHPWSLLRDHLDACALYCSPYAIEIRPVIPPALMHLPFEQANQRIYMSATLGEDGDLERSFGVPAIKRIPAPPGDWPERSTGRRLLMFPGMGSVEEPMDTALDVAVEVGKVLVLTANRSRRDRMCTRLSDKGFRVLGADGVEDAVKEFVVADGPVALVLANRYDGIDLPGDVCRLEIVDGLPRAMGLQETFMLDRLHATAELRDRVRTRVTQAIGRCTRDEADYAVVLALGDDFLKWAANTGNRAGMRTELQAEFEIGMHESEDRESDEVVDLCTQFLSNPPARESVESAVLDAKEGLSRRPDDCAKSLAAAVDSEVEFTYKMWQADYEAAHGAARSVIDALEGGSELKPYLSLWFHQAAVAAFYGWKTTGTDVYRTLCAEHIEGALSTSRGVRWYSRIKALLAGELDLQVEELDAVAPWFERIDDLLSRWGTRGPKYATRLAEVEMGIKGTSAAKFEEALKSLGTMLGAVSSRPKTSGSPDGVWVFENLAVVIEAKSDADPNGSISYDVVRQAALHEKRAREDKLIPVGLECVTLLVTPQSALDLEAAKIAGDIRVLSLDEAARLFDRASNALGQVRSMETQGTDDSLIARAADVYDRLGLLGNSFEGGWLSAPLVGQAKRSTA